jgi:lipoate-protein ligase A
MRSCRILDTGLASGPVNNAFDRDALARCAAGGSASLRFWRSRPSVVVGRHQALARELRLAYCREHGLDVLRRPSGGGAVYVDEDQLGFSLVCPHAWIDGAPDPQRLLAAFGEALVAGLERLGVAAGFEPWNDIEIDGRKLASFFLAADGEAVLLHGTLLIAADVRRMLEALRVPTEKLSADGLSAARDRLVTLRELMPALPPLSALQDALGAALAGRFGLRLARAERRLPREAEIAAREAAHAEALVWDADPPGWLEAVWKCAGGTLRGRARFAESRCEGIELAADMHCTPADLPALIEQAVRGATLADMAGRAVAAIAASCARMPGAEARDFVRLLELLADKEAAVAALGLSRAEANALMPYAPAGEDAQAVLAQAGTMLVPYCAKPAWCDWRHRDGCDECGLCEVGEAYRLARERGMRVTTVTNYEHLVETLADMRAGGERAYVGMCCGNFFIKRHRAFRDAGLPAVLMDISGANCYELRQEDQAYAGRFQAEARLDEELLGKVMRFVPARGRREE